MITSLDGYGATRNGGLVNSYTHATLQGNANNHVANFATLPHLHHNHAQLGSPHQTPHSHQLGGASSGAQQQHVRFGTLPVRGNGEMKPPPPYPGNYFNNQVGNPGNAVIVNGGPPGVAMGPMNGGNGILVNGGAGGTNGGIVNLHVGTPPHSSQQGNIQTQVIYTAK